MVGTTRRAHFVMQTSFGRSVCKTESPKLKLHSKFLSALIRSRLAAAILVPVTVSSPNSLFWSPQFCPGCFAIYHCAAEKNKNDPIITKVGSGCSCAWCQMMMHHLSQHKSQSLYLLGPGIADWWLCVSLFPVLSPPSALITRAFLLEPGSAHSSSVHAPSSSCFYHVFT